MITIQSAVSWQEEKKGQVPLWTHGNAFKCSSHKLVPYLLTALALAVDSYTVYNYTLDPSQRGNCAFKSTATCPGLTTSHPNRGFQCNCRALFRLLAIPLCPKCGQVPHWGYSSSLGPRAMRRDPWTQLSQLMIAAHLKREQEITLFL